MARRRQAAAVGPSRVDELRSQVECYLRLAEPPRSMWGHPLANKHSEFIRAVKSASLAELRVMCLDWLGGRDLAIDDGYEDQPWNGRVYFEGALALLDEAKRLQIGP